MDAFMNDVKQLFEAQDRLREFGASVNKTRKPLRVRERELSQSVTEYMRANRIDACDYRGEKLVLKYCERAAPITPDAVREAVRAVSGDSALADRCLTALEGRAPRQTVSLRRVKARKARAARGRARAGARTADAPALAPVILPGGPPAGPPGVSGHVADTAPPALSEISDDD
jgi:hypothetical protein